MFNDDVMKTMIILVADDDSAGLRLCVERNGRIIIWKIFDWNRKLEENDIFQMKLDE